MEKKNIVNSQLGENVQILGDCYIKDCIIEDDVVIKSSYIEGSIIRKRATIGPYAHIRTGCEIGEDAKVGSFAEVKNSKIGKGSKIPHLSYVGDATIGENCNIGCGVVFCNYDGKNKYKTTVGNSVFVGSNVNLVAPLTIGDNVFIAAGTTVTKDILNNQFVIGRVKQEARENKNKK